MKTRKIIISDIDGTILSKDKPISELLIKKVENWMKHSHQFVLATGRLYTGSKHIHNKLGLNSYLICASGATIYLNDELVHEVVLDRDVANKLWDFVTSHGGYCQIYCNTTIFASALEDLAKIYKEKLNVDVRIIDSFDQIDKSLSIHKFSFTFHSKEYFQKVKEYLDTFNEINYFVSLSHLCDVVSSKCDKANAIKWLREKNVADRYYAIGDNENDKGMIIEADFSGAIVTANDEIKSHADEIFDIPENNGIIDFIKRCYEV